ncbi:hypothetical protein JW964_14295 [candidate division KSB1 bacterium]|nr:hypothetical protein [candidate division KSB1 bacterium]
MYKKLNLLILSLMLFSASTLAIANPKIQLDTLQIYSTLLGTFEFYSDERYSPIKIYLEGKQLMGQERGCDPITINPINLEQLEFKAFNGKEYFKVTFIKDTEGRIFRLMLGTEKGDEPAERILKEPEPGIYSVAELQADFNQLRHALEENPDIIYKFTQKTKFDRLFDEQFVRINKPMPTEEFRKIIAPVVTAVGCLHTSLWMPPGYWKHAKLKFIPLRLVFLKGKAFVWRLYTETDKIIEGSEIFAINGKTIPEILNILKANISADGFNDSYRTFKINEGFNFRYALDFGFQNKFEIKFRAPGQKKSQKIVMDAVDLETVMKYGMEKNSTEYNALDYRRRFRILEEKNTAILAIRSFAYYSKPEIHNNFIDSAFTKIKELNIQKLILDLRNNDGGNPFCSVHLLSYLEPRPLPYFAEEYGQYKKLAHPIPLAANPFRGKLVTLINGDNVSTTPHFCALLKYHQIGKFVGTETGGTYTCNAATREIHLKHTRFIIPIARKSFAAAVTGFSTDRGVMPDFPILPTIDDLIAGKDVILDSALSLINR